MISPAVISQSPLEKLRVREICMYARETAANGYCDGGAGNFSVRGRDGVAWVSPTGLDKGKLDPARFVPLAIASLAGDTPWETFGRLPALKFLCRCGSP